MRITKLMKLRDEVCPICGEPKDICPSEESCPYRIRDINTNDTIHEQNLKEPKQGDIVKATRNLGNYNWQGTYFGKCNDIYLLDFNGTHCMVANKVEIIPTLTKKEAKQKISEMFANPKNISSQKVREIIDLIELDKEK